MKKAAPPAFDSTAPRMANGRARAPPACTAGFSRPSPQEAMPLTRPGRMTPLLYATFQTSDFGLGGDMSRHPRAAARALGRAIGQSRDLETRA